MKISWQLRCNTCQWGYVRGVWYASLIVWCQRGLMCNPDRLTSARVDIHRFSFDVHGGWYTLDIVWRPRRLICTADRLTFAKVDIHRWSSDVRDGWYAPLIVCRPLRLICPADRLKGAHDSLSRDRDIKYQIFGRRTIRCCVYMCARCQPRVW